MLYGKSGNLSNCFDIFGWNFEVGAVQKYVQLILYNWFSYIRQWSLPPPSFFRFFCIIVNTHFHYLIFNFGSFLPKDAYVKLVDLVKSCPHFHFFSLWYVFPPCPPLLKLWILFLNKILFQRVLVLFTSVYYLLGNIGVGTADHETLKVWRYGVWRIDPPLTKGSTGRVNTAQVMNPRIGNPDGKQWKGVKVEHYVYSDSKCSWLFEVGAAQTWANLADLAKNFQTSIYF